MKILDRLTPAHRALFWQILRYGVTGLFVTACQAAIYWTLAALAGLHPQLANSMGYVAAVIIGFVLHSAFTFRDHGTQGQHGARGIRFVLASLISYALNALWVFLTVTWMGWPEWAPIPAMLALTPAIMFAVNRQWVFR